MPNSGSSGGECSESSSNSDPNPDSSSGSREGGIEGQPICGGSAVPSSVISIVSKIPSGIESDEKGSMSAAASNKGFLQRSDSDCELCRVCQQQSDEPLINLGCRCRGDLATAHRSCIEIWFRTRGSNKCEICQQMAINLPSQESLPSTGYWIWRVDSAYRGTNIGQRHQRRCYSPLWIAFIILIGGLSLDILISVSLGVSALPVNIIIGVLIVLGLGTVSRLALEIIQEWGARRSIQMPNTVVNPAAADPGDRPAV